MEEEYFCAGDWTGQIRLKLLGKFALRHWYLADGFRQCMIAVLLSVGDLVAESEPNRERFQVAYVGDNDNDHSRDVEALGPALLAFGKLIRAANTELNQNPATMKVLVDSKFEHKCFRTEACMVAGTRLELATEPPSWDSEFGIARYRALRAGLAPPFSYSL